MDLQQTRPVVSLTDGVTRTIEWPSIDFVAGNAGRDVVLCRGPEPSLRWRAVLGAIVDVATHLACRAGVHPRRDPEHGVAPSAGDDHEHRDQP